MLSFGLYVGVIKTLVDWFVTCGASQFDIVEIEIEMGGSNKRGEKEEE